MHLQQDYNPHEASWHIPGTVGSQRSRDLALLFLRRPPATMPDYVVEPSLYIIYSACLLRAPILKHLAFLQTSQQHPRV